MYIYIYTPCIYICMCIYLYIYIYIYACIIHRCDTVEDQTYRNSMLKKKLATPWAVHFNNPTGRSLHQGTASPWKTWSAVTVPGDGGRGKGPFVVGYGGFG